MNISVGPFIKVVLPMVDDTVVTKYDYCGNSYCIEFHKSVKSGNFCKECGTKLSLHESSETNTSQQEGIDFIDDFFWNSPFDKSYFGVSSEDNGTIHEDNVFIFNRLDESDIYEPNNGSMFALENVDMFECISKFTIRHSEIIGELKARLGDERVSVHFGVVDF